MSVGFYFDQTRCAGCKACQVVCKDKNRLEVGILYREAHSYLSGSRPNIKGFAYSFGCNHCENPACLANCPVGAIYKAEDGTIILDESICIGCKTCVESCPYGQPKFNETTGLAGKCDGCYGLRAAGSQPACVAGCPNRALDFGEIDDLKAKYGSDLNIGELPFLPDPVLTTPHILIKAKEAASDTSAKKLNW